MSAGPYCLSPGETGQVPLLLNCTPLSSAAETLADSSGSAAWSPVSMMSEQEMPHSVFWGRCQSQMWVLTWGVLLCRGCAGGGVRVPVAGVVQGGDPVICHLGLREYCSEHGVEGLGSEPSCLALLRLLTAAPRLCISCSRLDSRLASWSFPLELSVHE